ncbi:hypothetical protein DXG01_002199 [Tephrocybe rancida]|nr:hypothetical protein DXG01_002199 [Tephrocybe rancida]
MKAPEMQTLELHTLAHFPLAKALPLSHLMIGGERPLDTTPPQEQPCYLKSLSVTSHDVLHTVALLPFVLISRLVSLDVLASSPNSQTADIIRENIQHILDLCASTLQYLVLRADCRHSNYVQCSLVNLTSLTHLT